MNAERQILHVDMDAFYASIEQRDRPETRGKPVLVGYDGPRGVVAAASYESRAFGCHSAQPISVARRRCPDAIILPVNMRQYIEESHRVFEIFSRHSDLIEPLSIDEAFIDVSRICASIEDAIDIARLIKQAIHDETQLRASVGVAPNKFLAKLASDLDKPDGLTAIRPECVQKTLDPLAINRVPGLGPRAVQKLHRLGVRTIGDLRLMEPRALEGVLGKSGAIIAQRAQGVDDRPVTSDRASKSISCEETFAFDLQNREDIRRELWQLIERLGGRLRRAELKARCVTIKLRYGEFETVTRSTTVPSPVDQTSALHDAARTLLDAWLDSHHHALRLLGVGVSRFERQSQFDLFGQERDEQSRRVDEVADEVVRRFGRGAIRRGASLGPPGADASDQA